MTRGAAQVVEPCSVGHQIIRASAGTGKTYQLSSRYLALVARGRPVESILAITFTRKAAGEILDRVLRRLAEAACDARTAAALGEALGQPGLSLTQAQHMLATMARQLHRVSISTIDSFFNRVAQSFRHELGIPPQPVLVAADDPMARQLRLAAIDAMLADEPVQTLVDLLRKVHHDAARRSVTTAIDQVVSDLYDVYRQAPDEAQWSAIEVPDGLLDAAGYAAAVRTLEGLASSVPLTGKGTPNKGYGDALGKSLTALYGRDWVGFLDAGVAAKIAAGDPSFCRAPIPESWRRAYEPLIAHARAAVIAQAAQQTQASYRLMRSFDGHYTRLRRQHRVMLFSDLPQKLARELPQLGEDLVRDVYFRLDTRVGDLLLDEFQDTSLEQWTVLRPFAEEICAYGDAEEAERSFFCVGDPKQAIYGWRGGCAQLFDRIEADLHLNESARRAMSESRRSSQVVLDAVNRVFVGLGETPALKADDLPQARAMQALFLPHTAHEARPGCVELITSPAGDGAVEDADDEQSETPDATVLLEPANTHERYVAEKIKAIVEAAPGRSVGVLVQQNKTVGRLIFQLRQAGVDASGEGGNPLTDDPAVNVILAALTLADHPGDSAAAFHVLHSPMRAILRLPELEAPGVSAPAIGSAIAATALAIRRNLLADGYGQVVGSWARELAPWCAARSAARLMQLIELADRYDPELTLRPGRFVDYVRATAMEEPSPAPVRVMTTHKAKGLEFDVVVLPELNRRFRAEESVYIDRPQETAAIRAVFVKTNQQVREACPAVAAAYQQQRSRRMWDYLCGLYVGMTRPRFALHLIARPLVETKSGLGAAGRTDGSYAAILRHALGELAESYAGGEVLYQSGDAGWAGVEHDRSRPSSPPERTRMAGLAPVRIALASPAEGGARRSWRSVSPSLLEAQGRVRAADLLALEPGHGLQYGTLLHAWFGLVGWLDCEAPPDEARLLEEAARCDGLVDLELARTHVESFGRMLRQPAIVAALSRPVLGQGARIELWRERPFAVRHERQELLTGRFDRVVVRRGADGAVTGVHLLDYKTDRVAEDRGNLDALVARYRPQVEAYRAALATMLRVPAPGIEATLLFVGAGAAVRC
ncbi:MAG: UvrD-helicase domain-containing protein [Phycisphaeraceae bacterium]